jgi:predicted alpha-1,6-mannanase (GH76 family)
MGRTKGLLFAFALGMASGCDATDSSTYGQDAQNQASAAQSSSRKSPATTDREQNHRWVRNQRVQESKDRLMSLFDEGRGQWQRAEWWHQPNILETLAEYERQVPGDQPSFAWVANLVFERNRRHGFINEFFDDTGWWALAWVRAFEVTGERRYLDTSRKLFEYLATQGWTETSCGGGMRWKTDNPYKNAITTELFLRLSLRLYATSSDGEGDAKERYRQWALKAWSWFERSGMVHPAHGLVSDGLTQGSCANNGTAFWTYNQGVILGALADMYTLLGKDERYLDWAYRIAEANWKWNGQDGVLREATNDDATDAGPDGEMFKGIFLRNLGYLLRATPDERGRKFDGVLAKTAGALWKNKSFEGYFDVAWTRPARERGEAMRGSTQAAGLDAVLAAPPFDDGDYVPDICFYEHWGFRGRSNCYPVAAQGLGYRDFFDQSLNDRVTSIRVFPGACLRAFEHWNENPEQRGRALVLEGQSQGRGEWLLSGLGFNDVLTSFEGWQCF